MGDFSAIDSLCPKVSTRTANKDLNELADRLRIELKRGQLVFVMVHSFYYSKIGMVGGRSDPCYITYDYIGRTRTRGSPIRRLMGDRKGIVLFEEGDFLQLNSYSSRTSIDMNSELYNCKGFIIGMDDAKKVEIIKFRDGGDFQTKMIRLQTRYMGECPDRYPYEGYTIGVSILVGNQEVLYNRLIGKGKLSSHNIFKDFRHLSRATETEAAESIMNF
jgi:hypothetical protein